MMWYALKCACALQSVAGTHEVVVFVAARIFSSLLVFSACQCVDTSVSSYLQGEVRLWHLGAPLVVARIKQKLED